MVYSTGHPLLNAGDITVIDLLTHYLQYSEPLSTDKFIHFLEVEITLQVEIASLIKKNQGVLLTEWISPDISEKITYWSTLYLVPQEGLYCVQTVLHKKRPVILDLSPYFPVCQRLQRSIFELTRIPTKGATDRRLWLNHGYFPIGILNKNNRLKSTTGLSYSFKKVAGEGVHEIPVGPVHAGIIEPGHFRFSVVGERILKLEERLGYTHKGIHQLLKNKSLDEARKLIGRISGDSTVAYSIAFAKACEHARSDTPSPKIMTERMLCLERERLCHHIGDIGAIINDAGLPSLQSFFHCLKEQLLRHNEQYLGHRYQMDCVEPFSPKVLFSDSHLKLMETELHAIEKALPSLHEMLKNHVGLQDRLQGTGIISQEQANHLGLLGVAAKASGIDLDSRRLFPEVEHESYITPCSELSGDVAARVAIRFKESVESIHVMQACIQNAAKYPERARTHHNMGIGMVEGWRGPIVVILSVHNDKIAWCHFHDPSWQNWLAVEYAVHNNIVADFPLINKSFNLSYSGHDS